MKKNLVLSILCAVVFTAGMLLDVPSLMTRESSNSLDLYALNKQALANPALDNPGGGGGGGGGFNPPCDPQIFRVCFYLQDNGQQWLFSDFKPK